MLPDSGFIQETEVAQLNRRNEQRGKDAVEPIYTAEDAQACLTQFRPVRYGEWVRIASGVRARFWNAGHLLGSASIELESQQETGAPKRLLFSGDIGPDHKVLEPDPDAPKNLDYVVCESTYGATERAELSAEQRRKLLRTEIESAMARNGALIIPSFAVERTQELLVDHRGADGERRHPAGADLHRLAARHQGDGGLREARRARSTMAPQLVRALNAHYVRFTESVEQSKAIARFRGFHIVIAASGMCEAGRIRHHLKNWLWRARGHGAAGRLPGAGHARPHPA